MLSAPKGQFLAPANAGIQSYFTVKLRTGEMAVATVCDRCHILGIGSDAWIMGLRLNGND